ncbi:MAG: phosphoglycerate dehydrogenase [Desulfobaccales bacterium]|nr:phosphoglycerate dehydrogenase [Desulfobaccales bacterium]
MKTILTTTSSFAKGAPARLDPLKHAGLEVVPNPYGRKLAADELLDLLGKYQPLGLLAGTEALTRQVLQAAKDYLRVISRVGAGWDNVDHQAAAELGMRVYRTPGVLTEAVAELTLGLILAALRLIPQHDRQIRQGTWQKGMGSLLQGKVVGLIGYGAIGQRVAELVRAFGARVIYYDSQPLKDPNAQAVTLPTLLAQADIISLHASGKEKILGGAELKSLGKPGVILINTARGELVDEEALAAGLAEGRPGFACLDVFVQEPYRGPLAALENVILTSHVGSYAREARQQMEEEAVANLLAGLREVGAL